MIASDGRGRWNEKFNYSRDCPSWVRLGTCRAICRRGCEWWCDGLGLYPEAGVVMASVYRHYDGELLFHLNLNEDAWAEYMGEAQQPEGLITLGILAEISNDQPEDGWDNYPEFLVVYLEE